MKPEFHTDGQRCRKLTDQFMKINAEILATANSLRSRGVPVFSGFPMIQSLLDLVEEPNFVWFALTGERHEDLELRITPDIQAADIAKESFYGVRGPLNAWEICRIIINDADVMSWSDVT